VGARSMCTTGDVRCVERSRGQGINPPPGQITLEEGYGRITIFGQGIYAKE
jgi:hypothetical protein